jgi:cell division protein FtsW
VFRSMGKRDRVDSVRRSTESLPKEYVGRVSSTPAGSSGLTGPASTPAKPLHLKIDVPLLLVVITMQIIGLVMVFSASYNYSYNLWGDPYRVFNRQLIWLVLGISACVALTFINYHIWLKLAVPAILITAGMLAVVLFINEVRNGAARTLFEGSIQPSELAKLMTVIYLAVWLYSKRERLSNISFGLIPLALILGILGGLIFIQPDLSAVFTIFILGGMMFFLAGGDLKQIAILLVVAVLIGWVVVQVSPTGADRVANYLASIGDPSKASYHVRRSLEAFINGSWLGVGIGNSVTKVIGLPVPPTDSIYAVIGEETGVFGSVTLVILYVLFFWRGIRVASRAPDDLGALLAAGLSLWIAIEAFINMAVMVNLMPFAGNALPFISYGGSNLVVSLAAVGILLNVSRLSVQNMEDQGRLFGAVVNLRWRDRGRRVSRPYRSTGAHLDS